VRHLASRYTAERVGNGISRTIVEQVDDSKLMQAHTLGGFSNEKQQDIEHVHPYGFTSVVQKPTGSGQQRNGAEGFMGFMGGGRSHGVVFVAGDRRYRLYQLKDGEAAMHDDQGQQVHFQRDGIWASVPQSKKIVMQIMDDDKMPQAQGQKMGQVKQAGRASVRNIVMTKDSLVINHPGNVTFNVGGTFAVNAAAIPLIASGAVNLKGSAIFTVGKTNLGVDGLGESASGIVPDVTLAPSKQTFTKLA